MYIGEDGLIKKSPLKGLVYLTQLNVTIDLSITLYGVVLTTLCVCRYYSVVLALILDQVQ